MGIEIERKFLLANDGWRTQVERAVHCKQGYLSNSDQSSVRIRIMDNRASLNIKSATLGVRRSEYEYQIPLADGEEMLTTLCAGKTIEKVRHLVPIQGHLWEIDEFEGDNAGLIVAEIELADENEQFHRPDWLAEEVSDDTRYYNVLLMKHPYKDW